MSTSGGAAAPIRETELSLLNERFREIGLRLSRSVDLSEVGIGGVLGNNVPDDDVVKSVTEAVGSCFLSRMNQIADSMEGNLQRLDEQLNRL